MALEVFTTEEYADDLEMSSALMELELEPLVRLSRDLKQAAVELKDMEVRFLVDFYYIWQEARKRSENIARASKDESGETYLDEPHAIINWMSRNTCACKANMEAKSHAYVFCALSVTSKR